MIQPRKSSERGRADHGWLKSFHTFSFADYYDPDFMGYRVLRVINEDYIARGEGFPMHPHRDMEIVTYVTEGALEHRDTLGSSSVIRPGEVQYMCAGTGVRHSEFNHSKSDTTHLLQIWIVPDKGGYPPSYAQKDFSKQLGTGELTLVVSNDGRDGSIAIHQRVDLYAGRFKAGHRATVQLRNSTGGHGWIQIVTGSLKIADRTLGAGDGAAVAAEREITLESQAATEFLLFDLP